MSKLAILSFAFAPDYLAVKPCNGRTVTLDACSVPLDQYLPFPTPLRRVLGHRCWPWYRLARANTFSASLMRSLATEARTTAPERRSIAQTVAVDVAKARHKSGCPTRAAASRGWERFRIAGKGRELQLSQP